MGLVDLGKQVCPRGDWLRCLHGVEGEVVMWIGGELDDAIIRSGVNGEVN